MKEVTRILQCIDQGDASAAERLLERVHSKLKQLAVAQCPSDPAEYSRHAAALVHELYLRLVDVEQVERWSSRVRFFSAAAEAMRRIAREAVRDHCERDTEGAHGANARGGDSAADGELGPGLLIEIDRGITVLAEQDPEAAELVKLRLFAGLSISEAGEMLGMSGSAAHQTWEFVRAWFAVYHRENG